jgi:hypothetical protein
MKGLPVAGQVRAVWGDIKSLMGTEGSMGSFKKHKLPDRLFLPSALPAASWRKQKDKVTT